MSFFFRAHAGHKVTLTCSRRVLLASLAISQCLCASPSSARGQDSQDAQEPSPNPRHTFPNPEKPEQDRKLPNGKSQTDAIAKQDHDQALKDANELIAVAEQLRDELRKAGNYVVPVSSVKKTEEIEKLARRIRGRLKD